VLSGSPSLIGTVILCLLLAILLGLTLIALGVLPWVQLLLFGVLGPLFGSSSDLAARNLDRHRRRHLTTALLFTLSVSLVIFVASLVALASRTAIAVVEHAHGADIKILAWSGTEEAVKQELSSIDGVSTVSEARFLRARSEYGTAYDVVIRDVVGMKDLWVVPFGVDADLVRVLYTNQVVWVGGGPEAISMVAAWVGSPQANSETNAAAPVILSLSIAQHLDVEVGDLVELSFRLGSVRQEGRFRVAGICSSLPGFQNFRGRVASAVGSGVLIPMAAFKTYTRSAPDEAFISGFFVKTTGNAAAQKAVAQRIRDQFDVRYRFGVQSTAEQQEHARVLYWATQVFFGLLLAVAVVIAVFALVASMASAVLERRREIGVLKALGMRRRQLFGLFLAEAIILTLSSGAAGGAIGFLLAWLFVFQASLLMELATVFTMPYLTFAATIAISIFAGLLAAHIPTRRLLQQTTAEILRG
jgi:putative ABC transport system permease protein